jgi:transposase
VPWIQLKGYWLNHAGFQINTPVKVRVMEGCLVLTVQDYTWAEAAKSLGIDARMLGRWVREHQDYDGQAFRGNGKLTPEQDEIKKLKSRVKRLEIERDILKKATAFFAAETK